MVTPSSACRAPTTSRSATSSRSRSCSASTSRAWPPRPARPAQPATSSRPTCWWPWGCRSTGPWAPCASRSVAPLPPTTSTTSSTASRRSCASCVWRCGGTRLRYSPTVVDHFLNPRNAGLMRDPDGVGEDEYEGCGDLARFFLRVADGRAREVRFQTYGCGPTIAAASAASELLVERAVEDLVNVKADEIERALDG